MIMNTKDTQMLKRYNFKYRLLMLTLVCSIGTPSAFSESQERVLNSKEGTSDTGEDPVKAMTFNVRYPAGNDTNQLSWAVRKDLVVEVIKKDQPDFLGTQEIVAEYLPFLEEELPEYAHIGRFRKGDGDRFDECSKIFYRKDRWEVIEGDAGSFQLSNTPEVVGSRDWTSMARVTTWARFRKLNSGRTLYVYNTHWDHRTGRDESSLLCAERIAARKVPEDPVIFMGDFNQRQLEKSIRHLLGEKVFETSPPIAMIDTDPETKKIDHVFVWPNTAQVLEAGVIVERFDVGDYQQIRPSDHDPTRAIIQFWNED
jgi:endonuclease/exonuclease/phosphatase family metal-dependent hydrolase